MEKKYKKTAVILAGGRGSRMGCLNKGELKYRGKTFIQHLLDKLDNYAEVMVISNTDLRDIRQVRVIPDEVKGIGPLGGIYTALIHSSYDEVLILSCDTPFIEGSYLDHLGSLQGDYDIALTTWGSSYEPLLSLYKKTTLGGIEELIGKGRYKISLLFDGSSVLPVDVDCLEGHNIVKKSMTNINTLDELRMAGGSI